MYSTFVYMKMSIIVIKIMWLFHYNVTKFAFPKATYFFYMKDSIVYVLDIVSIPCSTFTLLHCIRVSFICISYNFLFRWRLFQTPLSIQTSYFSSNFKRFAPREISRVHFTNGLMTTKIHTRICLVKFFPFV